MKVDCGEKTYRRQNRGRIIGHECGLPLDVHLMFPNSIRTLGGITAAVLALFLAGSARAQVPAAEVVRIGEDQAPRIDGSLTDPVWVEARWFEDFRQSVPDFGEPAVEPTRVAFLLDEHSLFVAVVCDDSRPDLIRAQKLRHRDRPQTDDHIEVVFDTYRDEIRGTVFLVNPLGAKEEGLVNGFMRYTWNWNEVWEVEAQITDAGWQAEFRIPLRLLRYRGDSEQTWGVNVKRVVRRLQEESYLSAPPPPYEISSLNFAGELSGLHLGKRQRNLQLIPYALGGLVRETDPEAEEELSDSLAELGLDVKYSITSDLTLNATINTDFSQVESDDVQVNLTRFSLFYPEKREFFLENADLFSFGHGGGFGDRPPEVTPFFSRRIGIRDGETVPIDAGLRLTGKAGRQDIGLLSVRTGGVPELGLDSVWYNIGRVRRDLGGRSYIGGILTDTRSEGQRSTTFGVDGTWYLTQDLSFQGDYLAIDDNLTKDKTSAAYAGLDLTTDLWGFLFAFREIEEGFDPAVGFVRRDGYRSGTGSFRRSIRPGKWGVRKVSFRLFGRAFKSLVHDVTESTNTHLNVEFEMENGDNLELRFGRNFERLFEPFELDEELVFPAGDYQFADGSLSYRSDRSRRWGVDATLSGGEFYDGDRNQFVGELWLVLSRHLRTAGTFAVYDISSPHGDIDWRLWSLRLDYIFSSTLSASGFLQHNSSTDTTLLNLRLRWILRNDSDLYFVYNESEINELNVPVLRNRELALKVSYRFFL